VDGDLLMGDWGKNLLELVDLIGKDRVFVSIYGGPEDALRNLSARLPCQHSMAIEDKDPIVLSDLPRITLPSGETRIKRIEQLAEVRNRALKPLQDGILDRTYDRVLFLNDVFFHPVDAARLLWGTNVNKETGRAEYKAVCGADFITSWKFYDTYATRDLEGYSMGVPIYPWFANEGDAISRKDVLLGKDAVRVKSCWGGIVAFDARYFQADKPTDGKGNNKKSTLSPPQEVSAIQKSQLSTPSLPLKFRSEQETFWDSSECCLIHADILSLPPFPGTPASVLASPEYGTGIFMNPFVRVSYDAKTFRLIKYAKRFERLFALPQAVINHLAHMPHPNYRRLETAGEIVRDKVWVPFSSLGASTKNKPASTTKQLGDEDTTWQGANSIGKRSEVEEEAWERSWADADYDVQTTRAASSIGDEDSTWQGWDSVKDLSPKPRPQSSPDLYTSSLELVKRGASSPLQLIRRASPAEGVLEVRGGVGKREIKPLSYWKSEGQYADFDRTASRGGYCGVRQLTIIKDWKLKEGEKNWENLRGEVPPRWEELSLA